MWRISTTTTTTTTTTTVTTAVTIAPASNNNYFNSRENIFVETVNLPFDTQTDKSLTTSRTYTIIACSQVCKRPISFWKYRSNCCCKWKGLSFHVNVKYLSGQFAILCWTSSFTSAYWHMFKY